MVRRFTVGLCSLLAMLSIETRAQTFTITGNMEYARSGHRATLLLDGRVLVTGGAGKSGDAIARSEIFDPATGAWSLSGSNITARVDHAAALLQDGRVLVVGGTSSSTACSVNPTAEIYDPSTGGWSPTTNVPIAVGTGAAPVRLLDRRVLITGGGNHCGEVFNTAVLFDPSSNTWSATAAMAGGRQKHSAILMTDGRVLVAGGTAASGSGPATAEIFDPAAATWTRAADTFDAGTSNRLDALKRERTLATVTWLSSGQVLAAGGYDDSHTVVASSQILDPVAGTWTAGDRLNIPRAAHTATRLANGIGVLIAGGIDVLGPTASAEIFHPVPEIPYEATPTPEAVMGRRTAAAATNSKGHHFASFVLADGRPRIFEYDFRRSRPSIVNDFGQELNGEVHTLRIDKDDNIWAVITETNTIVKFSPEGRGLMVLFKPPDPPDVVDDPLSNTPPPPRPYAFNRPTDIAWDAAGNIFVADGYRNSRVVKYTRTGRFLAAVGSRGSAPGEMNTPHSIVVDAAGNVYVADSGNSRIQVFDNSLALRAIYDTIGTPWALCITRGKHQYLYSASNLFKRDNPPTGFFRGEIYKMELDGSVIGRVGHADSALPGIRPAKMLDCLDENEILAVGVGFGLAITLRP